jgi:glycosyltransferase 2 family protein
VSIAGLDRLPLPGNNACHVLSINTETCREWDLVVKKQFLTIGLKYGLGLGLMIVMILYNWHQTNHEGKEVGISALFQEDTTFNLLPFSLAFVICGVCILLTFIRWFVLVRAQELPFTPINALRLGLFGFFASTFLPGSVTGDIPKAYFLAREHSRRTVAVATVVVDRIVGLCGLFWLAAFLGSTFWITGTLEELVQTSAGQEILKFIVLGSDGLVLANLVFWLVLGFISSDLAMSIASRLESIPKIGHSLAELWRAVLMYRTRGKSVLLALVMAMIAHNGFVLTFYLCSLTLYPAAEIPSVETHFLIVPVGMTIQAGFPTPGGLGGGEAAYSALYGWVGYVAGHGFMACLMQRFLYWVLAACAYFAWLRMKPTLQETSEEKNEDTTCDPVISH